MSYFFGKTAVVTGASSGIGRAIALALASKGATLALAGRDTEKLNSIKEEARTATEIFLYRADLNSEDDIKDLKKSLEKDHKRIDLLIHSAGRFSMGRFRSAPVSEMDAMYRINVRAPYLLTQALLPMLAASGGQVVFMNSSAGLTARENAGQYAATKHALKAVADSLRTEVNRDGIRVISVYPGRTATPMQEAVHRAEGKEYRPHLLMQPEDIAILLMNALSLPRTAEVTDIHMRPLTKYP